jgi:hypothetical protein
VAALPAADGRRRHTPLTPEILEQLRALDGAELDDEPAAPLPPELDPAWVPGTPMPNGQLPAHLRPTPRPTRRRELVAAEPVDLGA